MVIDISIDEAVGVIKEWGVDCDNFVSVHYQQKLYGGEPSDNSMECAQYFHTCLTMVCNLGIKAHNQKDSPDRCSLCHGTGKQIGSIDVGKYYED